MAYEVTSTAFAVPNIDEILNEDSQESREYIDVPAGTWNVQICDVYDKDYYDKTDRAGGTKEGEPFPNAIVRKLIPLEVLDEGKYVGQRIPVHVYLPPSTKYLETLDEDTQKRVFAKFNMGRKRLGMLFKACGLNTIDDLNDCSGKFVKGTLKQKGQYLNLDKAEPFGESMAKKIEDVKVMTSSEEEPKRNIKKVSEHMTIEEPEVKDDIPF